MGRKVIVTCALVGSATRKNQNPSTPYTPRELAESAHLAYQAGAAMVHVHGVEDDGTNAARVERIKESHDAIKERTPELIVNMTSALGMGRLRSRGWPKSRRCGRKWLPSTWGP